MASWQVRLEFVPPLGDGDGWARWTGFPKLREGLATLFGGPNPHRAGEEARHGGEYATHDAALWLDDEERVLTVRVDLRTADPEIFRRLSRRFSDLGMRLRDEEGPVAPSVENLSRRVSHSGALRVVAQPAEFLDAIVRGGEPPP